MIVKLFLFIAFVSLSEIYVLVKIGSFIGAVPTIVLVILSAIIGSAVVRYQGLQLFSDIQSRLAKGEMPGQQLIEGMMLIITGILLIVPGFITDVCGLLLLQPHLRRKFSQALFSKIILHNMFRDPRHNGFYNSNANKNDKDIIEGEFERKDDKRIDKK
ncbi:MAG: FxsA family protein [Psychromonas sp.]|nr:FxsA family protein [Psychromonas sp.]